VQRAKEEAEKKERKKRDKFQTKIERIKRQEIAEVKKEADLRISQILQDKPLQVQSLLQHPQRSSISPKNLLISQVTHTDQSFYVNPNT